MFYIRFANALKAVGLNQFHNALKTGSNIERKFVKRLPDVLVQEFNGPCRFPIIPFLRYERPGRLSIQLVAKNHERLGGICRNLGIIQGAILAGFGVYLSASNRGISVMPRPYSGAMSTVAITFHSLAR